MIDPNLIRTQLAEVVANLAKRGTVFDVAKFTSLEESRKTLQIKTQALQSQRNSLSKAIGVAKGKKEDTTALMQQVEGVTTELATTEKAFEEVHKEQTEFLAYLPNLIHDSVPIGFDETANVEVRKWGEPKTLDFVPKDHVDLTAATLGIDFEAAIKMSGGQL